MYVRCFSEALPAWVTVGDGVGLQSPCIKEILFNSDVASEYVQSDEFRESTGAMAVTEDISGGFFVYGVVITDAFLVLSIACSNGQNVVAFNVYFLPQLLEIKAIQGLKYLKIEMILSGSPSIIDQVLIQFWLRNFNETWEQFNLRKGWDAAIYKHTCDEASLMSVIHYSETTILSALHRFSTILLQTMRDEVCMDMLLDCLRKKFISFSCIDRYGRPCIFVVKKIFSEYPRIFSDVDMYDVGLLITLLPDNDVIYKLLEKEPAPAFADAFIVEFLAQIAMALYEFELKVFTV